MYYWEGITPVIGDFVEQLDVERMDLAKALGLDIPTLREAYKDIYGVSGESLHDTVRANQAYAGIKGQKTLDTRYLTEDIPTGLYPMVSLGKLLGVSVARMETLVNNPNCFIRPSPSAGSLGGVARKTRESIVLCEAAGYNTIFIETVGVGQSETAVHSMVDFFLLLMLGGAGDELQGIKRGIMEMADAIAITKADGDNIQRANIAKTEYKNALHLFPAQETGWYPKVLTCSSYKNTGIEDIWETIINHSDVLNRNHFFEKNRTDQARYWMYETINESLQKNFYNDPGIKSLIVDLEKKVLYKNLSSFEAARILLDKYYNPEG